MYLLVMIHLKLARRKPYLESWLNQKSVLNMFLPLLLNLARNMSLKKRRTLMKAFIESHFNYCPLILMFHSRIMNNKINRIHERALRLMYSDHLSSFDELLKKDRSFSIRHRNIESQAIELYKFFLGLFPSIVKNIFHLNTNIP